MFFFPINIILKYGPNRRLLVFRMCDHFFCFSLFQAFQLATLVKSMFHSLYVVNLSRFYKFPHVASDVAAAWGAASPRSYNYQIDCSYTLITIILLSQLWLQYHLHLCALKGNKTTGWYTNRGSYLCGGPVEKQNDFNVGMGGWGLVELIWHRTLKWS